MTEDGQLGCQRLGGVRNIYQAKPELTSRTLEWRRRKMVSPIRTARDTPALSPQFVDGPIGTRVVSTLVEQARDLDRLTASTAR